MDSLNCCIVDDNLKNIDLIQYYLQNHYPEINIKGVATNFIDACNIINETQPELIFSDIILNDGFDAFNVLDNIKINKCKVIFVTAYDTFAVKAFKYNAVDYIVKPIRLDEFKSSVDKAITNFQNEIDLINPSQYRHNLELITINSLDKIDIIKYENLIYLESSGKYTSFYLDNNKKLVSSKNIGDHEKILDSNKFIRVHNTYIINIHKVEMIIKSVGSKYCKMENGKKIPISKSRLKSLSGIFNL